MIDNWILINQINVSREAFVKSKIGIFYLKDKGTKEENRNNKLSVTYTTQEKKIIDCETKKGAFIKAILILKRIR